MRAPGSTMAAAVVSPSSQRASDRLTDSAFTFVRPPYIECVAPTVAASRPCFASEEAGLLTNLPAHLLGKIPGKCLV
jgi:hypothetical protein